MFFLSILATILLLIGIIWACVLFTNAIEHLGDKLHLGNNAVGSILAVVGTGLPETIIPLVALLGSFIFHLDINSAENIAYGAIIGSPFMLSTLALFLLGCVLVLLLCFKKNDKKELKVDYTDILRNYKYFLLSYAIALLAWFAPNIYIKLLIVFILLVIYCIYVYRTIIKSKGCMSTCNLDELIFIKHAQKLEKYKIFFILLQILVSLSMLIIFSHFFVEEIRYFSNIFNINPLILSLIITPFATELPECVNSIIWVIDDKDDLAVANILGAIVFQSTIVFSIGILLTKWNFINTVVLNALFVVLSCLFFALSILYFKKVKLRYLLLCGLFYFGYLLVLNLL